MHSHCLLQLCVRWRRSPTRKDATLYSDSKRDSEIMFPIIVATQYATYKFFLSVKQPAAYPSPQHSKIMRCCTQRRAQCPGAGSSSFLTWQPAFSSICAYFTVLSISGKTRILHVMGTESFSLASRTRRDGKGSKWAAQRCGKIRHCV